ncbi:long-chain acyl-CoA synthetase [Nitrosomonas sp. PY1]|uniref:AMP-dependent synthetase/ligase n=1 Tax=Nitrosomonas sp. PY1 TaxID=1803906 RepID=UPI001FC7D062|nr:long-chain fatty acid--CoA ligase [Nitrosomonas sp. PY1]GKS68770.1 long-chain acyl-CoA synthetase [Nitrosomonas sp. PY1]
MQIRPQGMIDVISVEQAKTLDGLFRERVQRSPENVAYRYFNTNAEQWAGYTWSEMNRFVSRWQVALKQESLVPGDRVAIMTRNCPEWVMFEQAALGLGLVVVPLYTDDRAENAAYILQHSGAKVLLLENWRQWNDLLALPAEIKQQMSGVQRIAILHFTELSSQGDDVKDHRIISVRDWLPEQASDVQHCNEDGNSLATIVYTSGTSGFPKGVMLSHHNILTNAYAGLQVATISQQDLVLSFLPLSHTFERTGSYYLAMMAGATTAYNRSISELQQDLSIIRPTLMFSVPRVFERINAGIRAKLADGSAFARWLFYLAIDVGYSRFEYQQGRGAWSPKHLLWPILKRLVADKVLSKLGGRLLYVVSGGAELSPDVSRTFIGLGLCLLQGYGMTESSPVVSINRPDDNLPASVGCAISGVEVKLGEQGALLIRGPNVMLGYWNNPEATQQAISSDGWLNSGDIARIDEQGHIFITGRLKEIIVLSTGEKVPPADMESAIKRDSLFEQVMVIGEARSYLSALVVCNAKELEKIKAQYGSDHASSQKEQKSQIEEALLERITQQTSSFPGYAWIRRVVLIDEPWTVENGLLTPTQKLKRRKVMEKYREAIDQLYGRH